MAKLKVPSLQHLARNWYPNPVEIKESYVNLVNNPPTFSYTPLFGVVYDLLHFRITLEQAIIAVQKTIKRESVLNNYISILKLVDEHFQQETPDFVQRVERRLYPIGRGLMIPFEPPLIYSKNSSLILPWFSFWKSNPISGENLSLFITIVDELLSQDPDLETARFDILDLSSPNSKRPRMLNIVNLKDIPRVSNSRKIEMLEIFAEGYFLAQDYIQNSVKSEDKNYKKQPPFEHPDLFQ